ncbi:MAG: helix-turn-helix domain-containing protein [Dehalococcoidia bacterium]
MAESMLLTVKDVQEATCLGRTKVYELIREGELPVVRIGRAVRIHRQSLERWITQREEDVSA